MMLVQVDEVNLTFGLVHAVREAGATFGIQGFMTNLVNGNILIGKSFPNWAFHRINTQK